MAQVDKVERALKMIQDLEKLKQDAIEELLKQREEIGEQLARLGHEDGSGPRRKSGGTRKAVACSVCVGQGKSGEGHNKRGHQAWLKEQRAS